MRFVVLILGLLLGALMFVQTFAVYALSGVANDERTSQAGAVGLFMALIWLVASALVLAAPFLSTLAFALAGLLGLSAATTFPDLEIWGGASVVLSGMSLLAWIAKRRTARRETRRQALEAQRHSELLAAVSSSPLAVDAAFRLDDPGVSLLPPGDAQDVRCSSCGAANRQGSRFCGDCGAALGARPGV